ncbi:MAG: SEL1-like repeat protein [Synergistaceae bacterium]|nr:SEL1-like repeat protein [Synergistaceae bacterium]
MKSYIFRLAALMLLITAASFSPSEAAPKMRVAVMNVTREAKLSQQAEIITGTITGTLAKSKALALAERQELDLIIREQKINASRLEGSAAKIGSIMGCQYMLISSLVYEASPIITVKVVEAATSKVVFADTEIPDASDNTSIIAASSRLADRVLDVLAGEQAIITDVGRKEIIINRGSSSGVRTGNLYRVYTGTKRNSVSLAIIKVKSVNVAFSTAELMKNGGSISLLRRTDKIEAVSKKEADTLIRNKKLAKNRPGENDNNDPALSSLMGSRRMLDDHTNYLKARQQSIDILLDQFDIAEEKDDPKMYYRVGMSLLKLGKETAEEDAIDIFNKKFEALYVDEAENVRKSYKERVKSKNEERDAIFELAAECFRQSAKKDNADGLNALGYMLNHGYGVKQDYKLAAGMYSLAAKKGHTSAQYNLAHMYYHGYGVSKNYAEALRLYIEAADKGHAGSQYQAGYMYAHAEGVKQDYAKAIAYYTQAAGKGNSSAQNGLGYMYSQGLGVKQDYAKAIAYYTQAADKGNSSAKYNLGSMYENGHGVPRDVRKAIELYRQSAEQGNEAARKRLKAIGAE